MATYYNTSSQLYDSATTYNGAAITHTYVGSITIGIVLSHTYYDGTNWTYHYFGNIEIGVEPQSSVGQVYVRTPTIYGMKIRLVPNSSMIIRQYKRYSDPQVTAGCAQCGCLVYNQ